MKTVIIGKSNYRSSFRNAKRKVVKYAHVFVCPICGKLEWTPPPGQGSKQWFLMCEHCKHYDTIVNGQPIRDFANKYEQIPEYLREYFFEIKFIENPLERLVERFGKNENSVR